MNIKNLIAVIAVHVLAVISLLPSCWTFPAISSLLVLYFITGCLGISIGYHRLLSHKSFETNKLLEYILVTCGALSFQLGPSKWVDIHKRHHTFSDTENDPHSPSKGFWWGYYGWLLQPDRKFYHQSKDPYYRFLDKYYGLLQIPLAIILYSYGGTPAVLWGIPLRICLVWHLSWINNSVTHTHGNVEYMSNDNSKNNLMVALLTFGEGWHNNHHAFPYSAKIGIGQHQFDLGWVVISLLSFFGLVHDAKTPPLYAINTRKL